MQTTITQHDLSQFNPPLEGQEAANWALENLGERIGFSSYKDVLRHLNITINPTQSGIITLQRAIKKAKMNNDAAGNETNPEAPTFPFWQGKEAAPAAVEPKPIKREVPQTADPLLSLLLSHLRPHLEASVDADQVREIVNQALSENGIDSDKVRQIVGEFLATMDLYKGVRIEGLTIEPILIDGVCHSKTATVLAVLKAKEYAYLHGPAGTGKSKIGESVATALELPFYPMSVCAQSTKSDLAGYMDAHGNYVSTIFRKAYQEGGVFLLDEVDNGNANVLNVLNNALANSCMAFPDGMVNKHPDFKCLAAANTFGTGASEQYIGRNALDAAFKDRFVSIGIFYEQDLERSLYGEEFCRPIWEARTILEGRTGWVLSMRAISRFRNLSQTMGKSAAWELAISNLSEQHQAAINHLRP